MEIWKPVIGYLGIYEVSDKGRVRSLDRLDARGWKRRGRILKPGPDNGGYLKVNLCDGNTKSRLIHQLVCESFIGPRSDDTEVCHGPNGRRDNSVSNLRYASHSKNMRDRLRDGTDLVVAVVCSDGREFVSIKEAERVTGSNHSGITRCCKGKQKTCGGYSWNYA